MGEYEFFRKACPDEPSYYTINDLEYVFYRKYTPGAAGTVADVRRAFLLDRLGLPDTTVGKTVGDLENEYIKSVGAAHFGEFFAGEPVKRINECGNSRPVSTSGWNGATPSLVASPHTSSGNTYRSVATGSSTLFIFSDRAKAAFKAGETVRVSGVFSASETGITHIAVKVHTRTSNTYLGGLTESDAIPVPANGTRITAEFTLTADIATNELDMAVLGYSSAALAVAPAGSYIELADVLIERRLGYGPITRRNLLKNPSAEVDASTWVAARGTVAASTLNPTSGTKSLEVTVTDASSNQYLTNVAALANRAVVKGLKRVRASADVRLPIAGSVSLQLYEYDAAGTFLGTSNGAPEVFSADTTQRISTVLPLRATTETVRTVVFTPTLALNAKYYVDSLVLEDADTATASSSYFDGRSVGAEWEGTPDASTSILRQYLSDPSKITRYFDGNSPGARWEGTVDASRSIMDYDWQPA